MYDFRLDSCGNVRKINYNNAIRDSFMSLPVSELQSFYGALSLFETMLNDRKYCIRQRLQAGASGRCQPGPLLSNCLYACRPL